jgi:hypothetical protein
MRQVQEDCCRHGESDQGARLQFVRPAADENAVPVRPLQRWRPFWRPLRLTELCRRMVGQDRAGWSL